MITMNDLYTEMTDAIIDVISRNLNIRYDEIDLNARMIEDLGATPLDLICIFIDITKSFKLQKYHGDDLLSIQTVNDLILYMQDNCDLLLRRVGQIIAQYLYDTDPNEKKTPISDVDLDDLFEDYAYEYKKNQKDIIRLLVKDLGYENLCLLDCLSHLTLEDIKTIAFEKLPYEQKKKDLISSLIKSIGIEKLSLLDDLPDLTLKEIKEIIHTNKETD